MTLDEAIKNEEEIAIQQIEKANALDNIPLFGMSKDDIEEIKECYKCSKEHEQLAEWLKELKQLREQTRWIPVSERLPEENGQYLITVKYKHVNDSYEDVYAEHGEWYDGRWDMFCFGHCGEVEDIIAWMPLPEPYKASTTGEEAE